MRKTSLCSLLVFVASCAIGFSVLAQSIRLEADSNRRDRLRIASYYCQRLHDVLDKSAMGTYALSALLQETHGKIENFAKLAPEISKISGGVKAVELVPNGVVTSVWPLEDNRQAIGLKLFENPEQRLAALRTRNTHRLAIAGPIALVQGGSGLCARLPVYLRNPHGGEVFWGFTETITLVSDVVRYCDFATIERQGLDYEVYKSGDRVAFSATGHLPDPVIESVVIDNSRWSLGIQPRAGWYSETWRNIGVVLVLIFSTLLASLARSLVGRPVTLEREVAARTAQLVEANSRLAKGITERDEAQQELAESEGRLRRLVDLAPIGFAILAPEGRFLSVNKTLVKILGYSEEELLSKRFQDITKYDHEGQVDKACMLVESPLDTADIKKRYICKDGSVVNVAITLAAIRDENGKLVQTISLVQDVTEKLNMEARLRQSQKMQAIGTLAGGIAHDFNNVLAVIRGNAQLLSSMDPGDPQAKEYVESISRTSERAQDLVRQILTFSRAEETPRSPRLLRPMLEDALQLLRATLQASVRIESSFEDSDLVVNATPTEVHRLMMNFGANAEAALAGEPGVFSISVRRAKACIDGADYSDCAEIKLSDSGSGIDKAVIARIFEPFFSTKEPGHGTGMGLSIVHGIVSSLGGAIRVESELGLGTTFDVLLPMVEEPSEHSEPADRPKQVSSHGARVLFIDDEPDLVFLGKRILCRFGHSVEGFTDPILALARLESNPAAFDIVCCDLTMPGNSGIDVAVRIREIRPGLPVLLMSGFVKPEDARRAERLSLPEIITKPDLMDALPLLVQRSLEQQMATSVRT